MPLARVRSIALVGVEGHPVVIEADIENGLVGLAIVGLPDTALREARDRIRSAIINSGERWPYRRITVGLSPASLPKRGSGFDIGIAVAILTADRAVPATRLRGLVLIGELGLDGSARPVPGGVGAPSARVSPPPPAAPPIRLLPSLRCLEATCRKVNLFLSTTSL